MRRAATAGRPHGTQGGGQFHRPGAQAHTSTEVHPAIPALPPAWGVEVAVGNTSPPPSLRGSSGAVVVDQGDGLFSDEEHGEDGGGGGGRGLAHQAGGAAGGLLGGGEEGMGWGDQAPR